MENLKEEDGIEPLRWALHGGPGTGKSHALRVLRTELFDGSLEWEQGVQYQVVAFQAVMAEQLAGETIHHAVGLNKHGDESGISLQRAAELTAGATCWRWLLVDELSMVSAELLARLEQRCRELVRDACKQKYSPCRAVARPFGGLNVILAGDMWQLEPPRGTFSGALPMEFLRSAKRSMKLPHAAYGQKLIQVVTELAQCERTQDEWRKEAQDEFRYGRLSVTSHAFLHGRPTVVPGSWQNGCASCGNPACQKNGG